MIHQNVKIFPTREKQKIKKIKIRISSLQSDTSILQKLQSASFQLGPISFIWGEEEELQLKKWRKWGVDILLVLLDSDSDSFPKKKLQNLQKTASSCAVTQVSTCLEKGQRWGGLKNLPHLLPAPWVKNLRTDRADPWNVPPQTPQAAEAPPTCPSPPKEH